MADFVVPPRNKNEVPGFNQELCRIVNGMITLIALLDGVVLGGVSASRIVATNAAVQLVSADLNDWIAGTTSQVTVTDDGDGSVTLSLPQSIATTSTPTFSGIKGKNRAKMFFYTGI